MAEFTRKDRPWGFISLNCPNGHLENQGGPGGTAAPGRSQAEGPFARVASLDPPPQGTQLAGKPELTAPIACSSLPTTNSHPPFVKTGRKEKALNASQRASCALPDARPLLAAPAFTWARRSLPSLFLPQPTQPSRRSKGTLGRLLSTVAIPARPHHVLKALCVPALSPLLSESCTPAAPNVTAAAAKPARGLRSCPHCHIN